MTGETVPVFQGQAGVSSSGEIVGTPIRTVECQKIEFRLKI